MVKERPIHYRRPPLPRVVINEPDVDLKPKSNSSLSDASVASSFSPSPIPAIREEGESINEAFIMDSDSNEDEDKTQRSDEKSVPLEILI